VAGLEGLLLRLEYVVLETEKNFEVTALDQLDLLESQCSSLYLLLGIYFVNHSQSDLWQFLDF
jgi:hypothetical protein